MEIPSWSNRAFGPGRRAARSIAIVVAVAVVVGGSTSPAQQYLPDALRSLANAAGPWFVAIFVAVWLGRSPLVLALVLAVAGFVLLNVSYGVVSNLRGFPYSVTNVWTVIAIPAGVVVGLAVTWFAARRPVLGVLGGAVPGVVLIAEGIYGLTTILSTTGPLVWTLELVGGAGWITWVIVYRLIRRRERERESAPLP